MSRGLFVTIEGIDGSGKSTLVVDLVKRLQDLGATAVKTREVGGTPLAEKLRNLFLFPEYPIDITTELSMVAAARGDHWHRVIAPSLEAGKIVVSDRWLDSCYVYQGARGATDEQIRMAHAVTLPPAKPDLTLYLDLPVEQALARQKGRGRGADVMEDGGAAFMQQARDIYERLIAQDEQRWLRIDATLPKAAILEQALWAIVSHPWSSQDMVTAYETAGAASS
jgi:dTMP kinase